MKSLIVALSVFMFSLAIPHLAFSQTDSRESLESHLREWYAAFDSGDASRTAAIDVQGPGFGIRTHDARPPASKAQYGEKLKQFFSQFSYYRIRIGELRTEIVGDTGLAWGVHSEDFQVIGRKPEKVRVRFTMTLRYEASGWRILLFHRDCQSFDEKGRYVPSFDGSP